MKTTLAIAKGLVIGAALIVIASLSSCAPRAFPVGPNPLDEPGEEQPTVESLHRGNVRAITNNPTI